VIKGVSDQIVHITPFSATNKCGTYETKWKYTGVDSSDGHLIGMGTDLMKVDSETGSIIVS
jgi:hypothetical protein